MNYTHICNVGRMILEPGAGSYVVKAVARWKPLPGISEGETDFAVQSMCYLEVHDADVQNGG